MTLRLVPPSNTKPAHSAVKVCALLAFRTARTIQAKAAQVPVVLTSVRDDITSAWRESADSLPNV